MRPSTLLASRLATVALGLTLTASAAQAELEAPPRPRSMSLTRPGSNLWNSQVNPLYRDLQVNCAADEANGWMRRLAELDAAVAALPDADDRAAIAAYLVDLRAWVVRIEAGVPDAGTWDDARAAIKDAAALAEAPVPPDVATPEHLQQTLDLASRLRPTVDRLSKFSGYAEYKLMNCGDFLGPQGNLVRTLQERVHAVEGLVLDVLTAVERDTVEPYFFAAKNLDGMAAPTTWTRHAVWVGTATEVVDRARAIVADAPRYAQLATFAPPRKGGSSAPPLDEMVADAQRRIGELGPVLATRLAEVGYPSDRAKDPARVKVVRSAVPTGLVNGPTFVAGTTPESWDEYDHGVSYRFKRLTGWGYYVVKPATWREPRPDGVAPDQLCELRSVHFQKYTDGGPSITKGRWYISSDRYLTPILCKNAKRISKLK